MSQQYSLRWNNHQPNFISMFTSLLNTQTLVDVTLAAEGQQLQAHKVVLSACSTYFQALFVDNPSRHPIVILKDVTFADLRTMVDFMYYGEVNVTEQQLPKVLDTAKHLKIKGLTEMPDTASLRAQGTSADFQSPVDSADSQRHSVSPSSPVTKRKRRRKSSTGSTSLNMVIGEENKEEKGSQTLDLVRGESITLSSVPQQRRVREYHDERTLDHMQQTNDPHNLNVDPMSIDPDAAGMPQGGQWSVMEHTYPRYSNACLGGGIQTDPGMYMNNVINPHMDNEIDYSQSLGVAGPSPGPSCVTEQQATQEMPVMPQKRRRTTNPQSEENFQRALEAVRFGASTDLTTEDVKLRRSKLLKRQTRVIPEERIEVRKQVSEPTPQCAAPMLQKHESYPEYESKQLRRVRLTRIDRDVPSIFIQDTSLISTPEPSTTQRASHTPAVRAGPPLSCNFCWNTVDDTGRILRRKTQYHCPECRTNLCIVPCFHEYHEGPESEANASAK